MKIYSTALVTENWKIGNVVYARANACECDNSYWVFVFPGHDQDEDDEKNEEAFREEVLPAVTQQKAFNPKKFREIIKKGDCVLGNVNNGICVLRLGE